MDPQQYEAAKAALEAYRAHPDHDPAKLQMYEQKVAAMAPAAAPAGAPSGQLDMIRPLSDMETTSLLLKQNDEKKAAWEAAHNRALPTASQSKNPDLIRDVEWHPTTPPGFHPLTAAMSALPTYLGGSTVNWHEPSLAQFHRDGGQGDEGSPEFAEYKDHRYAQAFDEAQKSNQGIVRREFIQHPTWTQKVAHGLDQAAEKEMAYANGIQEGGAFGLPAALVARAGRKLREAGANQAADSVENGFPLLGAGPDAENAAENNPLTKTAGEITGIIAPQGLAGKGAGAILKGAGKLAEGTRAARALEAAPGLVKGFAEGATEGALGGALQSLGTSAVKQGVGDEKFDPNADAKKAIEASLFGAGAGGAMGGVSHLAGKASEAIAKSVPGLAALKKSGMGDTSLLKGVSLNKEAAAERDAALAPKAEGPGGTPQAARADKIAKPYAQAAEKSQAAGEDADNALREAYFASIPQETRPVGPVLQSAMKEHAKLVDDTGTPLITKDAAVRDLQKNIAKAVGKVSVRDNRVAAQATLQSTQADEPQATMLTGAEARKQGIDVDAHAPQDVPPEKIDQLYFIVSPKRLTAPQLHETIKGIDDALKLGRATNSPKPEMSPMAEASREVRDSFPDPKGILKKATQENLASSPEGEGVETKGERGPWSAFENGVHARIQSQGYRNQMGGLPESVKGALDAGPEVGLQRSLAAYGTDRLPAQNRATQELGRMSGTTGDLNRIAGFNAFDRANQPSMLKTFVSPKGVREYMPGKAALLHLDPLLRLLASPGAAPAAGRLAGQEQLRAPLLNLLQVP